MPDRRCANAEAGPYTDGGLYAELKMGAIEALIVMRIVASLIKAAGDDLCGWISLEGYQFT